MLILECLCFLQAATRPLSVLLKPGGIEITECISKIHKLLLASWRFHVEDIWVFNRVRFRIGSTEKSKNRNKTLLWLTSTVYRLPPETSCCALDIHRSTEVRETRPPMVPQHLFTHEPQGELVKTTCNYSNRNERACVLYNYLYLSEPHLHLCLFISFMVSKPSSKYW